MKMITYVRHERCGFQAKHYGAVDLGICPACKKPGEWAIAMGKTPPDWFTGQSVLPGRPSPGLRWRQMLAKLRGYLS